MKKYFTLYSAVIVVLSIQNVSICMDTHDDDEHTQSVIWFRDKVMPHIFDFIRIPIITRLAKEKVAFYNTKITPIVCSVEKLKPNWRDEERLVRYRSSDVASYQDCLEIKHAQREGYESYKDDVCYNDMIRSMAAGLYYKALGKGYLPPYPCNSAVNLGCALDQLSCSKEALHGFVYKIGWIITANNLKTIAQIWKNFSDKREIVFRIDIGLIEAASCMNRDRFQCCIKYLSTLLAMSQRDVEGYFKD